LAVVVHFEVEAESRGGAPGGSYGFRGAGLGGGGWFEPVHEVLRKFEGAVVGFAVEGAGSRDHAAAEAIQGGDLFADRGNGAAGSRAVETLRIDFSNRTHCDTRIADTTSILLDYASLKA
jgi:hypothetical protein